MPVEPKVFDLLAYVIRNRDRVVSKDDLLAAIWNGRIVSESALTTCINAARNAIGDTGEAQRLIKTLPRKGIRFVGSVREQEGNPPAAVATDAASARLRPSLALPDKPTVAVLPFTNMSGDPEQEYFSDGITEDIITDLSKVSALNVLSRNTTFTFKGQAVEIGQIAQRLKVSYVIEGSVRKAGGRVRITAQLIDANKDSHIWGERYDRDLNDIFVLQDEIAQTIVAALKIRLLPEDREAIESRSTKDPKAYQLYLLARFYRLQYPPSTYQDRPQFLPARAGSRPRLRPRMGAGRNLRILLVLVGRFRRAGPFIGRKGSLAGPHFGRSLCREGVRAMGAGRIRVGYDRARGIIAACSRFL